MTAKRSNMDSYNLYEVWNNKIIKDVGEPRGIGNHGRLNIITSAKI